METRRSQLVTLLRLAAPLAAVQAGNQLMGFVDTAIVGRLGAAELAGVGLANGLFFAVTVLGIGIMLGMDPLISQSVGAGDHVRARRFVWQAIWLAIAVGALLAVPLALLPLALRPIGVEPDVAAMARSYLLLRIPGVIPLLVYFGLRSYLQAVGTTRAMVIATVAGNVFNFPADLLLVFGGARVGLPWFPALGVSGAAIATVLATLLQVTILIAAVRARPRPATPVVRAPDPALLAHAGKVGLPVGLQMAAEVGVFALAGVLAARLGAHEMASHQIALTLASFSFCVAVGVASAGSVLVGRAIGAGDAAGTRRAGLTSFAAGAALMAIWGVAFLVAPRFFASILTDQPDVIAAAAPLLVVAGFFQISDGIQAVGSGVLRGAGDTRFAFVANLVGHWTIGLPVAVFLGLHLGMGVVGLWWGLLVGLTAVALTLFLRFRWLSARPIRPLHDAPDPDVADAA
jgi:MATE family multidrug resistance protein